MTNSRAKGCRGERLWRDELRAMGYSARRGQQFAGGGDSPDVLCESLPFIHHEVKFGSKQYINFGATLEAALLQAFKDAKRGTTPVVAWKQTRGPWMLSWIHELTPEGNACLVTTSGRDRMKMVLDTLNRKGKP